MAIKYIHKIGFMVCWVLIGCTLQAQQGYGNQLIFGRLDSPAVSTILNFNSGSPQVEPVVKDMELEGTNAIMCDSVGKLLFYSNGCYIANATHQMMVNGDSIGKEKLESSYCKTGGNPVVQCIISLPAPNSNHLYYLIYFDLVSTYTAPFFPLAPRTMYYAVIDMNLDNGLGAVTEKNQIILQDTFSLGQFQAQRHSNNKDWWIVMPQSLSNCYWTALLTENGIDTVFRQCIGNVWGDRDSGGQSVFSPSGTQYARMLFFNGMEVFDFNPSTGLFYNDRHISMGVDTFGHGGVAYSPNSRFLYTCCSSRLFQYDTWASDIEGSKLLVAELTTPDSISPKTRFNQARLAPDGKIYIAGSSAHSYLHVIHRPNCYGVECSLQQYAVPLFSTNAYSMPNMPHYIKWDTAETCQAVGVPIVGGGSKRILFYPNPTSGVLHVEGLEYGDQLEWMNSMGVVVQRTLYEGATIPVSHLSPGFYWIKVTRKDVFLDAQRVVIISGG